MADSSKKSSAMRNARKRKKIRDLLAAERLPEGEEYLWPCMDPDFYFVEHEPETTTNMPGAWDEE